MLRPVSGGAWIAGEDPEHRRIFLPSQDLIFSLKAVGPSSTVLSWKVTGSILPLENKALVSPVSRTGRRRTITKKRGMRIVSLRGREVRCRPQPAALTPLSWVDTIGFHSGSFPAF